jgi:acyl-homoserine lactone acylase PvdQ
MMRTILALFLALAGSLQLWAEKITIYRDSWGTPHIYAETERGAVYGQGYAAAEDRLEQILRSYLEASGHLAAAFGPQHLEQDFTQQRAKHEYMAKRHYNEQSAEARAILEAYVAGLQRYVQEHPERVPSWAPKIEPWQPVALGRYVLFGWWGGEAMSKLGRRLLPQPAPFSNQWAIAPSRTADGAAILMIDPHLSWTGFMRFHEVRLHGGDLHLSGTQIAGAPLIGLGHNRYLGWAATTGGPSTTDVYEEELNPQNPLQYRYDGQWRDLRAEPIEILVKTDSGLRAEKREVRSTQHGPIILTEGNRAYALKSPYMDQIGFVDVLLRQARARNLEEFKAAMGMNQWMQQNIMYADVEGNIYYLRAGRVPIRPKGYDFLRVVPGNTSASEWLGIHPLKDLPQVLNPSDGYMQNCNADPMTMMAHPPFKPEDYAAYLYNDTPYRYNSRAERARQVLEANHRMTLSDAMGLAFDTVVHDAPRYLAALGKAAEAQTDPQLLESGRAPLQILLAWDGRLEAASAAATLFDAWLNQARRLKLAPADLTAMRRGEALAAEKQKAVVEALVQAADTLRKTYGAIEVAWGQAHRVARGSFSYPVAGGDAGGISVLRAITFSQPDAQGLRSANGGQSMPTLVIFKKTGVESYSALPWGESDDPASPHFADQAEKLVSRKALKPTWFEKEQLMPHVVSVKTLEMQ